MTSKMCPQQDRIRAAWWRATKGLALTVGLGLTAFATSAAQAQTYTILHSFTGSDELTAGPHLVRDTAGNLYGVSQEGGNLQNCTSGCGDVYKFDPTGKLTALYTFQGRPDGAYPEGLLLGENGDLYGTTQVGGKGNSQGCGGPTGGGCGAVFKVASTGKEKVLHSFAGPPNDGMYPYAGVIRDGKGNSYGTTLFGGSYSAFGNPGEGTVYKVNEAGKETVLYNFTSQDDGGMPWASLLLRDDILYGTTSRGGTGSCSDIFGTGCGTVFKVEGKKQTVLYSFKNKSDGGYPLGALISDSRGNLYGTTALGGDLNCVQPAVIPTNGRSIEPPMEQPPPGCGTVFKLSPDGKETILYTFKGTTDGSEPVSTLLMDSAGNLYGTAPYGGDLSDCESLGCGTVFKIDAAGHFSVLHTFTGSDGEDPGINLVLHNGSLYGTAQAGGKNNAGVIFKLTL